MMSLEKRIQALEARLIADPVVLCFAAGSKRELRGWGDFLLRLFQGAFGGADLSRAKRGIGPEPPVRGRTGAGRRAHD